jgi:hypothetical protein
MSDYVRELKCTIQDGKIVEVIHRDFETHIEEVSKEEVRKRLHDEVDGRTTRLWSDNHFEEASTIVYVIKDKSGIWRIVTEDQMSMFIYYLKNTTDKIYEVNIEDNLL